MRNSFLKFFCLALIAMLTFSSCDEVESPYEDGGTAPPPPSTDTRRVLIIDFTGHRCAGCPAAARNANNIASDFPEQIFALSVHPDIDGLTNPVAGDPGDAFTTDWRTPEGNQYQSQYSLPGAIPLGAVNAVETGGNIWSQTANWRSQAEALIEEERPLTTSLEISYDDVSREMEIATDIEYHTTLEGNYNLVLMTVENNIVDWQKNGTGVDSPSDPAFVGGNIPDYVHKHVMRNHVNGLQGEEVVSNSVESGATMTFSHSDTLDEDYVAEECSIYAYVYNTNTLEILDITEHHITN